MNPRIPDPTDNPFLDLAEWRERRSAESAFGRLEVLANRVRHALPVLAPKTR